jgi:hypothetical protein
MLTVVGRTPRMPVLPVSMVMDLIATKIIVCVAMVDCRSLALMQHEPQARQLLQGRPRRRPRGSAESGPANSPAAPTAAKYPV